MRGCVYASTLSLRITFSGDKLFATAGLHPPRPGLRWAFVGKEIQKCIRKLHFLRSVHSIHLPVWPMDDDVRISFLPDVCSLPNADVRSGPECFLRPVPTGVERGATHKCFCEESAPDERWNALTRSLHFSSINKLSVQLPSTQAGSVKPRGHVAPDSRLPEPRLSSHYYWHAVLFASSPRTGQRKVTHPHRRAEPSSEWNIRA